MAFPAGIALGGFANGLIEAGQAAQQNQNNQLRNLLVLNQLRQLQQQQQAAGGAYAALQAAGQPQQPTGIQQSVGQDIASAQSQPTTPGFAGPPQIGPPISPGLAQVQRQILSLEGNRDNAVGAAGEFGPGQIKPATGAQYGYKPAQLFGDSGRQASARIAGDLYQRSGGDPAATLVGYNAGPGAMARFQASGDAPSALPANMSPAYRATITRDIGLGGQHVAQVAGPEVAQATTQGALTATAQFDPVEYGRVQLGRMTQAIDAAMPNADPAVKMMALLQAQKALAPEDQLALRTIALQNQSALHEATLGLRAATLENTARHEQVIEAQGAERVAQGQQRADQSAQNAATNPQHIAIQKFLEEHPDATAQEIQSFIQQGRSARSGPAMAAQRYLQEHPNATSEEIQKFVADTAAQVSATRGFATGPQGNTVRSINVAVQHLDVLQNAADALANNDVRAFNRVKNLIATETGSPTPTDFNSVKNIVKDELVKAILGGVGALGDRQEVEANIAQAASPEQLRGTIRRYIQLMGGQASGLERQYTTSHAGTAEEFEHKLEPRTRDALKRAQGEGAGVAYAPGDIIERGGKRYKVIPGGTPDDPEVEETK